MDAIDRRAARAASALNDAVHAQVRADAPLPTGRRLAAPVALMLAVLLLGGIAFARVADDPSLVKTTGGVRPAAESVVEPEVGGAGDGLTSSGATPPAAPSTGSASGKDVPTGPLPTTPAGPAPTVPPEVSDKTTHQKPPSSGEPTTRVLKPVVCDTSVRATSPTAQEGWCGGAAGSPADEPNTRGDWRLTVTGCRGVNTGDGTLHFPTSQEIEFVVKASSGETVWTWSSGRTFDQVPHERFVKDSSCIEWAVLWDGKDASGRALPAGSYALYGSVKANEMAGTSWRAPSDLAFR